MDKIYDVIVIGGGPGGFTAALYAARAGLSTLVIEKMSAGGQMTQTMQIDNYPGFEEGVDGFTLGMKMQAQAEHFGVETKLLEVFSVNLSEKIKVVETDSGEYRAKVVIVATGADHRHLGIENEEQMLGKGVGYCAACDGMLYRGKTVAVVGGGNSAAADALLLSKICEKVILIHRRDTLRASKVDKETLKNISNIEFCWNSVVSEIIGDEVLKGVKVKNVETGEEQEIECQGLFISIGRAPATDIFKSELDMDENGYIIADESTCTNVPGVYVVGDARTKMVRQIVTAMADGAVAVYQAEKYLAEID